MKVSKTIQVQGVNLPFDALWVWSLALVRLNYLPIFEFATDFFSRLFARDIFSSRIARAYFQAGLPLKRTYCGLPETPIRVAFNQ